MPGKSINLSLSRSDRLEDLIGKIELATETSGKARIAYNILKKHPGMVTFHTDYIMNPDGTVELIGVCMDIKSPGTQEARENGNNTAITRENGEDSLLKPLQ